MNHLSTINLAQKEAIRLGIKEAEFILNPKLTSFEISRKNGKWIFNGPREIELLYAVYDCAERFLGYDFFEPGTEYYIEENVISNLSDGILVKAKPPRIHRCGFIQEFPFERTETLALFDYMVKNKLNYLLVWMKYYDELDNDLKEFAAIRGITIESGHHNFEYLIPHEKYGINHPDYFAITNKENREKDLPGVSRPSKQLCTTNPALRKEVAKQILNYCDKNPELTRVGLNPNDGYGWCECPRCKKYYTPDDHRKMRVPVPGRKYFYAEKAYDEFIENVAKEIHKKRPDLTLNFFAYVNYCSPYKDFKLTPGISVQLANYWRCVNHDLFSANCPSNKGFLNDLLAWGKAKAGGELMIYEYYMGINFYMSLPLIFEKRIFDEFEYYKSHKVDGVLTQFQMGHWSIYGSNYKAMSMAARGEDYTCTIKTILQNRFGKYAAIAEKFFQDIKNITDLNDNCHIPTPASLFSRISVKQLEQLQPVARKLARNLPYARPAADLEIWIKYLITFKKLYDMDVNRTIKVQDMTKFITWIKRQKKRKIFAITQVIHYLSLWLEDVKNNVPCRFFDVDWPKEFERRKNIDKKQ